MSNEKHPIPPNSKLLYAAIELRIEESESDYEYLQEPKHPKSI
jgi:hypothetical protein